MDSLYGVELERRKFVDSPPSGKCWRCNQFPSSTQEQFLALMLSVPNCNYVEMTSLLTNYYNDDDNALRMKCSECCEKFKSRLLFGHSHLAECKQEGVCSRPAVTQRVLTYAPSTLLVLLKRFNHGPDGAKTTTLVMTEDVMDFHGHNYQLVGTVDHLGDTLSHGHWVTRLRSEEGQWLLYNDAQVSNCSSVSVVSGNNVLLLFKMKAKAGTPTNILSIPDFQKHISFAPCYSFVGDEAVNCHDIKPATAKPKNKRQNAQEDGKPEDQTERAKQAGLLDTVCRGCCKDMQRLLRHLNSNKGKKCMESYSMEDIEEHKRAVNRKTTTKYVKTDKGREVHARAEAKYVKTDKGREEQARAEAKYAKTDQGQKANRMKQARFREKNKKKRENMTEWDGFRLFWADTAWGAIYPCISCHKCKFRNGVQKANFQKLNNYKYYKESVDPSYLNSKSKFHIKGSFWICLDCHNKIKGNSMPACSAMNSLQIFDRPACLELTEVENVLLAPRIAFMKMIKLPVSRMRGIRDRIVNVPIPANIIKQTVESLPRTYAEAGIIAISLRKKRDMLSTHREQWVDPEKMTKAYR